MEEIVSGVRFIAGILKPFFYGGVIAFILNIPMNALEKKLFQKRKGKYADKLRRPISLFLSILIIMLILSVIVGIVIPQLTSSIAEIGRKIPAFMQRLEEMEIVEIPWKMEIAEIPWESVIEKITQFLKNGAGDMLSSTFNMVGSIISAVADILIAFVFAIYILAQKEKLMNQLHRILTAYCSKKIVKTVEKVCSLLNMNFRNFITGQCLEAVILGTLFVIFMSILRLPYALVIGVLITLTALIPIVGAFIGCAVGVFLILIESPVQAVIFLILCIAAD
jgi:predicted PurR-regulated permease PerM